MLGTWCPDMMTSPPFSLPVLCVSLLSMPPLSPSQDLGPIKEGAHSLFLEQACLLSHIPESFPVARFHFAILCETQPLTLGPLKRRSVLELVQGSDKPPRPT
jgi:hypothetical protein